MMKLLHVDAIHVPRRKRRGHDAETMKLLMDSIKEIGLLNPVCVSKDAQGRWVLETGDRRLRAVKQLGRKRIKCLVVVSGYGEWVSFDRRTPAKRL